MWRFNASYKRHARWEGTSQRHKSTCDTSKLLNSTTNSPVAAGWNTQMLTNWIWTKTFQKVRLTQKGPKLNVLIRDKISFVGVTHLTRGGRSCSWALYRWKKRGSDSGEGYIVMESNTRGSGMKYQGHVQGQVSWTGACPGAGILETRIPVPDF